MRPSGPLILRALISSLEPTGTVSRRVVRPHGRWPASRDQVAAVLPMGAADLLLGVARAPRAARRELVELGLELEHPLDAGEVQTLVGELCDAPQPVDVGVAVAAAAAGRAGRVDAGPCARRCAASADARRPARRRPRSRRRLGCVSPPSSTPPRWARGDVGRRRGERLDRLALLGRQLRRARPPRR